MPVNLPQATSTIPSTSSLKIVRHLRPYATNLCHDALQLFYTSRRGIDVRRSQPRTQQKLSAEDVQREIAIVSVIAMEESPFLLPVQRIVGSIQVQNDFFRLLPVGCEENLH